MPYIIRDTNGNIAGIYNQPVQGGEEVSSDDEALQAFVRQTVQPEDGETENWLQSDMALARVMEDLIDVLIDKNLINFTDFPESAQKKLLSRRGMRSEMVYLASLFDGIDEDGSDGGGYL